MHVLAMLEIDIYHKELVGRSRFAHTCPSSIHILDAKNVTIIRVYGMVRSIFLLRLCVCVALVSEHSMIVL